MGFPIFPENMCLKYSLYKLGSIEVPEVFNSLPHPYIAYRDIEFIGNGYNNASLGRTVEFCNSKTSKAYRLIENLRLLYGILACSCIDYQ